MTDDERAIAHKLAQAKYAASDKGKARAHRNYESRKGRGVQQTYYQSEAYRESRARYLASPKGRAMSAGVRQRAWAKVTPTQKAAWLAVRRALDVGSLVVPAECQSCGIVAKVDAHHHLGYAIEHWLTVTWLCRRCHKAAH